MNHVCLSGRVSNYGPKISWTEAGKPQTTFTLVVEDAGREGSTTFKTFVPVLIVGTQAEQLAETLDPGDQVLLEGKLAYHKTGGKDAKEGRLTVVAYGVGRLATLARDERAPGSLGGAQGDAWGPGPPAPSETKTGKPRYPKWHAPAERPR